MKYIHKYILEAINRGIQLALDDYDDDNQMSSKRNIIKNDSYIKDRLKFDQLIKKFKSFTLEPEEFPEISFLSKKYGFKYKVKQRADLDEIIGHTAYLDDTHKIDLNWLDVSQITDMSYLFQSSSFNRDISEWDVSNVIYMTGMFSYTYCFQGDLSKWDVSNVISMIGMFNHSIYNGNLSNWNISKECNTYEMFTMCPITPNHMPKQYLENNTL